MAFTSGIQKEQGYLITVFSERKVLILFLFRQISRSRNRNPATGGRRREKKVQGVRLQEDKTFLFSEG